MFGSRRKQVVKTKFVVSALVLLAVIMLSLLAFLANQRVNSPSTNENVANLLPEITNCTVQTGVPYSNDSNPYRVMDVYLPESQGPFPAIIYVHGGGWVRGSRSDYNYTATFYAQRGIAGFAIDYTLSTPTYLLGQITSRIWLNQFVSSERTLIFGILTLIGWQF